MFNKKSGSDKMTRTEEEFDIMSIFSTLWNDRTLIGIVTAIAVAVGVIYATFIATPIYRATSVVMLDSRQSSGVGLESVLGALATDTSTVNTEVQVLKGRKLLGRVVEELKLTDDIEFNPTLQPASTITKLKGLVGLGRAAELDAQQIHDATTSTLLDAISIRNVLNSLVFEISVSSSSARTAAAIADTLARLYIEDQLRVRFDATSTATSWLTNQVAEQKAAYEAADAEVRAFRASTTVIDSTSLAALDRQLKDMRRRIDQIQQDIREHDARINTLTAEGETLQVYSLTRDRDRLTEQLKGFIEAEMRMSADLDRQSQELTQLEQLLRNAEASRLLYEHFQMRLKETSAQQGINQADSRVLSEAVVPMNPIAPRKNLIVMLSILLGLMFGCGIVLSSRFFVNRVRSMAELEALTGLTVLTQTPRVPRANQSEVVNYLHKNPSSETAEAVRNLRTALMFSSQGTPPQVIAVSSSIPGEGKTTTSMSLAANFTMLGKKVLVIEGDIRMNTLSRFNETGKAGGASIIDILDGSKTLAEVRNPTKMFGDVIYGSNSRRNAADLFSSPIFGDVIAQARKEYDIIIVDTPPVLAVPDVKIIARHTDGVLFVVRWDHTTHTQIREALHQLHSMDISIIGLVLSNVDASAMKKYGYGGYGSYGNKYYETEGSEDQN